MSRSTPDPLGLRWDSFHYTGACRKGVESTQNHEARGLLRSLDLQLLHLPYRLQTRTCPVQQFASLAVETHAQSRSEYCQGQTYKICVLVCFVVILVRAVRFLVRL